MSLTRPQTAILHVSKAKLGLDDETWRQVLVRVAGVTSSTELDRDGFEAVMGFFDYAGFRPAGKGAPRYGARPGMASFAQIEMIRQLWRELHREAEVNDEALAGWLLKYHKLQSLRGSTLDAARQP